MDPITGLAIASVAAPIVGGIVGNVMGAADRRRARQLIAQGVAELKKAGYPPDLSTALIFEKFKEIGIETPELEEDIQIAASEVAQLEEDPALRNAQLEALGRMKSMSKVGLGAQELAALNLSRQQTQQDVRSNIDALAAAARRRGEGQTSGSTLAAQLQTVQSGADRGATEGLNLAGLISQKIKEGAMTSANMASGIRSQDYQAEMARRQAEDERNRFIATNAMARQRANIDRMNEAQARREAQAMQVSTANTQMSNAEKMRQNEAQRQYWQDTMSRAQALANAYSGQAGNYQQQATQTGQMWSGIGSGIGQGIAAYGQAKQAEDRTNMTGAASGLKRNPDGTWG